MPETFVTTRSACTSTERKRCSPPRIARPPWITSKWLSTFVGVEPGQFDLG